MKVPLVYCTLIIGGCLVIMSSCKSDTPTPQVIPETVPLEIPTVHRTAVSAPGHNPLLNTTESQEATTESQQTPEKQEEPKIQKKVSNLTTQPATLNKPQTIKPAKLPVIKFDLIRHDFGTIVQGDIVDYNFTFTNTGNAPLEIDSAKVTCGCTHPSYPFVAVEVGESGYIGVRYNSVGKEGLEEPLITVYSNASVDPITLMFTGKVLTAEQDSLAKIKVHTDTLSAAIDTLDSMK